MRHRLCEFSASSFGKWNQGKSCIKLCGNIIFTSDCPFTNSHFEQKTLAFIKCDENYANLNKACGPLFREIEQVHTSGEISIDGTVFQVVLFLGGDMKFLQLSMGLSGSTSSYA